MSTKVPQSGYYAFSWGLCLLYWISPNQSPKGAKMTIMDKVKFRDIKVLPRNGEFVVLKQNINRMVLHKSKT